jgi:2-dehydropantoate 2-reductase
MTDHTIAVLGGGSVGLCLAAHFAEAGARVFLLVRSGSVADLEGKAIEVSGLLGDRTIPAGQIQIRDAAAPGPDARASDMLIVTTKAYDLRDALAPFASGDCPAAILLLQNGMGSAEIAREVVGPDIPIYSSAMMIGMVRHAPNRVEITAQSSPILCGALLDHDVAPLERLLEISRDGFIPMARDPAIRETIAFKLLFNSCMNPTGAITGQTYGELLDTAETRAFIVGLADETLQTFAAAYDYRPAESGTRYVDEILADIVFPPRSDTGLRCCRTCAQAGRQRSTFSTARSSGWRNRSGSMPSATKAFAS